MKALLTFGLLAMLLLAGCIQMPKKVDVNVDTGGYYYSGDDSGRQDRDKPSQLPKHDDDDDD